MRYWWVNQNQTYRHEVRGGYLWSLKRKRNQSQNPFYDFMREVAPGDAIFSFADTVIRAIGIAASHAFESPKPLEFGQAGAHWDLIGWRNSTLWVLPSTSMPAPTTSIERHAVFRPVPSDICRHTSDIDCLCPKFAYKLRTKVK